MITLRLLFVAFNVGLAGCTLIDGADLPSVPCEPVELQPDRTIYEEGQTIVAKTTISNCEAAERLVKPREFHCSEAFWVKVFAEAPNGTRYLLSEGAASRPSESLCDAQVFGPLILEPSESWETVRTWNQTLVPALMENSSQAERGEWMLLFIDEDIGNASARIELL